MNEEELRKAIGSNLKRPGPDFTDKVMNSIEQQPAHASRLGWRLFALYAGCVLLLLMSFIIELPELRYQQLRISVPNMLLPVLSVLFILYLFGSIYNLRNLNNES